MAWAIGDTLNMTKSIREGLPFIHGLAHRGFRPQQAYEEYRAAGLRGRKQSFLDAFRAISYAYDDPRVYTPSDPTLPLRTELIPIAPFRQNRKYRTIVEYIGYDPNENAVMKRHITIDTDTPWTVEEYIEDAIEVTSDCNSYALIDPTSFKIRSVNYTDNPLYG